MRSQQDVAREDVESTIVVTRHAYWQHLLQDADQSAIASAYADAHVIDRSISLWIQMNYGRFQSALAEADDRQGVLAQFGTELDQFVQQERTVARLATVGNPFH